MSLALSILDKVEFLLEMQLKGRFAATRPPCVETTFLHLQGIRHDCIDSQDDLVYQKSRLEPQVKDHTIGSTSPSTIVSASFAPRLLLALRLFV
jgi:hypothetical protein